MLLGDIIANFEDPAVASEALARLDNLVLMARIAVVADEMGVTPGEFALQSIGHFITGASDEDWLNLVGAMSRADDPGQAFLQRALSSALAPPAPR